MFKDFGKDVQTAISFAKHVCALTNDVNAAEAYPDTWNGNTRIKVKVLKKYDAIAAEAWNDYLLTMVAGTSEKNTPVLKVKKAEVA